VAPEIFPRFTAWDGAVLRAMLRPSLYFGMISTTAFLGYQLPLILLQRIAGPGPVVVFTLMRKLFGFGRQMLTRLTMSMGPEITRAFGASDWPALYRLYDYSERFIFALIVPGNAAMLYASPLLLMLWMHRPGLFNLVPYVLMAAVANVICLKEHKLQFQFSTNTHIALARTIFFGYLGMGLVSLWSIRYAGVVGFLLTWLASEIIQTGILVRLNIRLFAAFERISMRYLTRLVALIAASVGAGYVLLQHSIRWSYPRQIAADIAATAAICVASWYLFHLYGISAIVRERVFARLKPAE
jgi:hypothetical protein